MSRRTRSPPCHITPGALGRNRAHALWPPGRPSNPPGHAHQPGPRAGFLPPRLPASATSESGCTLASHGRTHAGFIFMSRPCLPPWKVSHRLWWVSGGFSILTVSWAMLFSANASNFVAQRPRKRDNGETSESQLRQNVVFPEAGAWSPRISLLL